MKKIMMIMINVMSLSDMIGAAATTIDDNVMMFKDSENIKTIKN